MDVIQNVTSEFTTDLLMGSVGYSVKNDIVAPYFMIPLIIWAASGAKKSPNPEVTQYDMNNDKNVAILDQLIEPSIQYTFSRDFTDIKKTHSTKVLHKLLIPNTHQLVYDMEQVANRVGFDVEYIDMTQKEAAKKRIGNNFIQQGWTNYKVCSSTDLTNATAIYLNRVEFKGDFEYPHDIKYKKWIRFWTEQYRYQLVEAMHFQAIFLYAEYSDMRLVVVPYNDLAKRLSLMIVLPNSIGYFNKIAKKLNKYQEKILNAPFEYENVRVDIPIFTIEEQAKLECILNKLSLGNLFRNATIDNVFLPNGSLQIKNIQTHVKIIVDGKETSPDKVIYHHPKETERVIDIKINRPFIFYVIDMETRVPYLSGIVADFNRNGVIDHSIQHENDKNYVQTRRAIMRG